MYQLNPEGLVEMGQAVGKSARENHGWRMGDEVNLMNVNKGREIAVKWRLAG